MASRTPRGTRRRRATEPSFPVIPIAIGVVILGFAIGAGIPALRHPRDAVVAVATASPLAAPVPSVAPMDAATSPPPTEAPSPTPRATASRTAKAASKATPLPAQSSKPTQQTPSAAPTQTPAPVATAGQAALAPASPRTLQPAAAALASATPLKRASSEPEQMQHAVAQLASPAATEPPAPQSPLLRDAEQTVRTYIEALAAGDDTTAQAQLLANAGTPAAQLSEKEFVDGSARIVGISATETSPTTASVDVDVRSGKGAYYAHYELRRLDSGVTLIREHNFTKT